MVKNYKKYTNQQILCYINNYGEDHGYFIFFLNNGQKGYEGCNLNGRKVGIWKYWHNHETRISINNTWLGGIKNGISFDFYKTV